MNTPSEPSSGSGFPPNDDAASSTDTAVDQLTPPRPASPGVVPPPPAGAAAPPSSTPSPWSSPPAPTDSPHSERRGKPPYSKLRTTVAVICLLVAVLAIVPALLARWVRTDVASASGFADNAVAVLDVPEVRDQIVELFADELMEGVTGRRQQVRPLVVAAVDEMVSSEDFEDSWRDAMATTHDAVMAALFGRDQERARVVGDEMTVELDAPLDGLSRLLRESGVEADLDGAPSTVIIELADLPDENDTIGDILSRVDSAGLWLPLSVALLLAGGLAAAVNRWRAALITGIGLACSGGLLLIVLSAASGPIAESMASSETLTESGVESVIDVFTGSLGTMAKWVVAIGVVGVVAGVAGPVVRSRRS